MTHRDDSARKAAVEAGAGRPFRFSLVLGDAEGRLLCWFGGKWAAILGVLVVGGFAAMGGFFALLWPDRPVAAEFLTFASAGIGALAVAIHLRPRTVLFERREGTWRWRERGILPRLGWSPITEQEPLRLEREPHATVEGWTLYWRAVRLFSYLGDPSIGRSVSAAFQEAGVPVRTVMRPPVEE
jgi:hypothetical protein